MRPNSATTEEKKQTCMLNSLNPKCINVFNWYLGLWLYVVSNSVVLYRRLCCVKGSSSETENHRCFKPTCYLGVYPAFPIIQVHIISDDIKIITMRSENYGTHGLQMHWQVSLYPIGVWTPLFLEKILRPNCHWRLCRELIMEKNHCMNVCVSVSCIVKHFDYGLSVKPLHQSQKCSNK